MADHYRAIRKETLSCAEELGWRLTRTKKGYVRAQAPNGVSSSHEWTTVVWPNTPR